jgi:Baculovirus 33KDa late protein (PP31)
MATTTLNEIKTENNNAAVVYDKAQMDQVTAVMHVLEKKKLKYNVIPMPVYGDEGLQMAYAIMITIDKKGGKKSKKMISNNKYILFNSWYTKNRKENWPNSHTMWNLMKQQPTSKPFVEIFDVMEKLGKTVELKKIPAAAATNDEDVDMNAVNDINEGNERRTKLYNEFYRITTQTFNTKVAPASSFIYDIRLNKSHNGIDRLTSVMLQNGVEALKKILHNVVYKDNKRKAVVVTSDEEKVSSRKRKQSVVSKQQATLPKQSKKSKNSVAEEVVSAGTLKFSMLNDHIEDSQMSFG